MVKTLNTLLRILFMRASPADLPYSPVQTAVVVVFYLAAAMVLARSVDNAQLLPLPAVVGGHILTALIWAGFTLFMLSVVQKTARWWQTYMAVMGIEAIFAWLSIWPQMYFFENGGVEFLMGVQAAKTEAEMQAAMGLLSPTLMFIGWIVLIATVAAFAVLAKVLSSALEKSYMIGLLYAVLVSIVAGQFAGMLLPSA